MDTALLASILERHVLNTLDGLPGSKTLVLSHDIAGILGLSINLQSLQQHGVDRLFYLEPGPAHSLGWARNVVYVCHARIPLMSLLAAQVSAAPEHHSHTLLVAPRLTSTCRSRLQDDGVLGSLDIRELPTGLVPLEPDLLSLEYSNAYRSLFFDHDYSPVYEMAQALITFQRAFGLIPRIIGKGTYAQRLAATLERLKKELPPSTNGLPLQYGQIDSMVIFDRSVDMVTPLCTQLTYAGLIDECIGIKHAHVEVDATPSQNTNPAQSPSASSSTFNHVPKKRKHHLSTTTDSLYSELCDANFAIVGNILNRVARRISLDYESRHSAKTPSQLRDLAGRLVGLKADQSSLVLHTGLTEQIMKYTTSETFDKLLEVQQNLIAGVEISQQEASIKDLLNQQVSPRIVIRLICLYSLINGGIKPKVLDEFKRDFLQAYGYDYLTMFIALSSPTVNLLSRYSGNKSPFAQSRKPFKLIVDDVDEQNANDLSYVFSGYAPLFARLVQGIIEERKVSSSVAPNNTPSTASTLMNAGSSQGKSLNGWKGLEDAVRILPGGPIFEKYQKPDKEATSNHFSDGPPITLVCILGGITYAEVSALRWLSRMQPERRLIICTTGVITGTSLISEMSLVPL